MIECRICEGIFRESDLIHIQVEYSDRHGMGGGYYVCPGCLAELIKEENQRELSDEEEAGIRAEWAADDEYQRMKDAL